MWPPFFLPHPTKEDRTAYDEWAGKKSEAILKIEWCRHSHVSNSDLFAVYAVSQPSGRRPA
jgi:hypothetical protein